MGSAASAVPTPLVGDTPTPVEKIRVDNPRVLPLTGTWGFQLTRGRETIAGFQRGDHFSGSADASSEEADHDPQEPLLDSDSRWCAADGSFPQWWSVDLGAAHSLHRINIRWESDDAPYQFKIEGSTDRKTWSMLADRSAGQSGGGDIALPATQVRWMRITVLGTSGQNQWWASIRRVHIFLKNGNVETEWAAPPATRLKAADLDAFARPDFNDAGWSTLPVPGNWEMEGFSRPTYGGPDSTVGLYRRWIDVPPSFAGRRIIWHFDGVNNGAEIFINGARVGYHESGFTAFDIDVTDAIKPGQRNLLALRVAKTTPTAVLDKGDFWDLGGINRETYLAAVPPTHVSDVTVVTDLDRDYRDAILNLAVQLTGSPNAAVKVTGSLFDFAGEPVPNVNFSLGTNLDAKGNATLHITAPVVSPKLWSAEKPNLYYVVLALDANGAAVEHVQERFGFRKIEIRNGVVLWNGVPIKCTGTCRHEEWAAFGHALTEDCWQTDVKLMKAANINAVRTSHYNHAARFLELCEEKGFYVLDEVPGCWWDVHNPAYKDAFLQRSSETLARDKNRPCVLAWSMGNESGYGPDNLAGFEFMKAHDPTRPAFISQCGPWNNRQLDFADYHYPSIATVRRIATERDRQTIPAIFTEQPHIFYITEAEDYDYGIDDFWGNALVANWNVVWKTDSIVGSFIWEWQDQGIADKNPDRGAGLRNNNNKGIVDGYRNPKPEYWQAKMAYSPVTTSAREIDPAGGSYAVPLENRYSFTDLSELTCKWQALGGERELASGETHIACPPRSSVSAAFPATAGMDTLRIEFIHPDGRSIYAARLRVKGFQPPAPPSLAAGSPVTFQEKDHHLQITTAASLLVLDEQTGAIQSWGPADHPVLVGGPVLNLGEARVTHGEHDARDFIASRQPPLLKDAVVSTKSSGDSVEVSVTSNVLMAGDSQPRGQFTYTLLVHPDAQADLAWSLKWTARRANAWELGIKLPLSSALDRMTWSRQGLWTEYPPGYIGQADGSVKADDVSFACTKRDARWVSMTGSGVFGLAALAGDQPLHVRAHHGKDQTVLFLSSFISPPYDFSTSLLSSDEIHLLPGRTFTGGCRLRLTSGQTIN
ncbi:MAG: glycoside hydrolase family 2 TIM barrel-domain containing protein [Tepidisphaeraceae bacterium]